MNKKSGEHTLLMSVILSSPSPLVVGAGLLFGRSSTQIADFFRRTAELLAIIASFVVYKMTTKKGKVDIERKKMLERRSNTFVGLMMLLAGGVMIFIDIIVKSDDKGNVIPGLVIAGIGAVANSVFWLRYRKLNKATPNVILEVQSRLYRAKALVDTSVTIALVAVLVSPEALVSYWFDLMGSLIVAGYLIWCGLKTIYEAEHRE